MKPAPTSHAASQTPDPPDRRVIQTLAKATRDELTAALDAIGEPAEWRYLRRPEIGLIMVRGRTGGGGAPFNLGEATVTRASVALTDGTVGHAYALGRDKLKAHAAALLHALWSSGQHDAVEEQILCKVEARVASERQRAEEGAAATTVEFFTMARGSV